MLSEVKYSHLRFLALRFRITEGTRYPLVLFTNGKISQAIKLLVKEITSQRDFCAAGLKDPSPTFSKETKMVANKRSATIKQFLWVQLGIFS